jgi:single-strand selective monofunctional uracil DNA glycosylase
VGTGVAIRSHSEDPGLVELTRRLARRAGRLAFAGEVACVYNPLEYAWACHEQYLERYGRQRGVTLLLGMNPGPFGMAQTGVPFGEVGLVREWLAIDGPIGRPRREHPKRPIQGFACARSEVSGARLWGWARQRFGTPEAFFQRFFVWNYCPLAFLYASGANCTPDKLPADERQRLYQVCDEALAAVVDALEPRMLIGIGKFAETRARQALAGRDLPIATILHPSPASPIANRGWAQQAEAQLRELGLL